MVLLSLPCAVLLGAPAKAAIGAEESAEIGELAEKLRDLPTLVIPEQDRAAAARMLPNFLERRLQVANARSTSQ